MSLSILFRGTPVGLSFVTPAFAHNSEPDVTLFTSIDVFDGKDAAPIENARAAVTGNTTFLPEIKLQEPETSLRTRKHTAWP